MNIDIEVILQVYKEEIAKLQNENIALKCQIVQMNKEKQDEEQSSNKVRKVGE